MIKKKESDVQFLSDLCTVTNIHCKTIQLQDGTVKTSKRYIPNVKQLHKILQKQKQ